jgi:hypothetical protein
MDATTRDGCLQWDPYAVWQIMLHRHPVWVEDPAGSTGHIDGGLLTEFCEAISDYPDFLQDIMLLIAHAEGVEAAVDALDAAVREHLAEHPGSVPAQPASQLDRRRA